MKPIIFTYDFSNFGARWLKHFGRRVFISSIILLCLLEYGRAHYYGSVKPTTICAFLGSVVVYFKKCVLAAVRSALNDALKISHFLC